MFCLTIFIFVCPRLGKVLLGLIVFSLLSIESIFVCLFELSLISEKIKFYS